MTFQAFVKQLVCVLFILFSFISVKGAESDTVIIRHFDSGVYKATSFNYTGIELQGGVMLFANESGVLQYDGSEWTLIPIKNFSPAVSLLKVDDKIYVGGRNEFGYLKADSTGAFQYHSMRNLLTLEAGEKVTDIWQIIPFGDDIYFQSLEMLFRFDGQAVHKIPLKNFFLIKVDNTLYASVMKEGLALVEGDSIRYVNKDFRFDNDMAYQYLLGLKGEHLLFTADNGIYELNKKTHKVRKWNAEANTFLAKNSLYHTLIWQDSLYASATYLGGLVLLNKEGKIVSTYNKEKGLNHHALREMIKDKRGNLWLTSDYGLVYLQFNKPEDVLPDFKTQIRSVSINDHAHPVSNFKGSLVTPEDYSGSVVFRFATPGYHKEELEYSYYLEPFEQGWSTWKTDVKKEYTNLNGGDYVFHVKSRVKEGVESQADSLKLSIPVPWFKTNIAYLLGFVLLAAIIMGGVQYRTKRLRTLNKRLAEIVEARTRELVVQKEQLKDTNRELRIKNTELDNFVYRSSHDLVAPLKSLKGLINIAQMEKEKENQATYFNLMHTSVDKLESFIKSIMEYSTNSKHEVVNSKINLNEILDSVIDDIRYYERTNKVEIVREICEDSCFISDPKRLKIILSNLITNSIKYHNYKQERPFIEIKAHCTNERIVIEVADNGKGIEREYIDKIFDMFFRASNSGVEGSGLGLYIVKDTVQKLNGTIQVSSELGKGTRFTLIFPVAVQVEEIAVEIPA